MAYLEQDKFESWIRERSRGCMTEDEIECLVQGEFDIEGGGPYVFHDQGVQAQWEAWQASFMCKLEQHQINIAKDIEASL